MAKNGKKGLLNMFLINEDEDDEYDDDYEYSFDDEDDDDDYEEPVRKTKAPRTQKQFNQPGPKPASQPAPRPVQQSTVSSSKSDITKRFSRPTQTASDKLVSFDSGSDRKRSASGGEVYVIKPQEFDDAQTVVDFLKRNKAIVINMEGLQLEPAQRIIDFIGGACYGINGDIKAISANIFIAVPNSIEVSGDLREEILNSATVSPLLGQ
ncbi:MAG: cell division protein SepF [Eubacterium sp.]|nr:cell division protein SepF [Eubacterium sp.]